MSFIKEVRDIRRFKQILTVLLEEGFEFLLHDTKLHRHVSLGKRVKNSLETASSLTHEQRLRRTLERLGPTFVKFGQVLSLRPDLLPLNYIRELEKLQDDTKPLPYSTIKRVVEKELRCSLSQKFKTFSKTPVASASISQVHKATLRDGTVVAVKIQRPDIAKQMQADIDIMGYVASKIEKRYPQLQSVSPTKIVKEFTYWTTKELDFAQEARNQQKFYRYYQKSHDVIIPKVYGSLSNSKVLITEFIVGTKLHELKRSHKHINKVIEHGFNCALTQVFDYGFFHADPHPGNILITKSGKLALVDFGICGHFDDRIKAQSIDLLHGVLTQDADAIVHVLSDMGLDPKTDKSEFAYEIKDIIEPLQQARIGQVQLSHVIEQVMQVSLKHHVRIPMQFVLFGKTLITLEGLALEYDPEFSVIKSAQPFMQRLILQRYSPKYQLQHFAHDVSKYKRLFEQLPDKAQAALDRFESGRINIHLEDSEIRHLADEIDTSSNRIAYGLIIAGLLIASAFMVQVDQSPAILGIPIIALASFSFALFMGLILLISILKEHYWRHL